MAKKINNKALDHLNWKILNELYMNARLSNTEIGRRVGLSAPAVADRIQKMEQQQLIRGYSTNVQLDKAGLVLQAFISFRSKSLKHAAMVKLFDRIPEIMQWYSVTGTASMFLRIAVTSSKELEAIVERLQDYGETSTSVILSESTEGRVMKKIFHGPSV